MFKRTKRIFVLLIVLLCMTVTMTNSTLVAGAHSLSASAENLVVGGSCSSFADGFSVGMGIATLFGCAWCPIGGIAARVAAMYLC
jgi:hypothetical protein